LPEQAKPLVDCFVRHLQDLGVSTQSGQFGAHMLVSLENDGPVTILLEH
jgi:D-tyrosyl-tRNA(Tyr) deacylase